MLKVSLQAGPQHTIFMLSEPFLLFGQNEVGLGRTVTHRGRPRHPIMAGRSRMKAAASYRCHEISRPAQRELHHSDNTEARIRSRTPQPRYDVKVKLNVEVLCISCLAAWCLLVISSRKVTFVLLFVTAMCLHADQNLAAPNLSQIANDFEMTPMQKDGSLRDLGAHV